MKITWRDVIDCKSPGMHVDEMRTVAKKAGYKFFCHNARVFCTDDNGEMFDAEYLDESEEDEP